MAKAILISINPKWVKKILNGEKTIEIRKKFPKDYVGWVYIYCTKDNRKPLVIDIDGNIVFADKHWAYGDIELNGKVVARFWCDKVEEISFYQHKAFFEDGYEKEPTVVWQDYCTKSYACGLLEEPSCLTFEELHDYLKGKSGYAIHITKLEIFDKPKELNDFRYAICPQTNCEYCKYNKTVEGDLYCTHKSLTRAPQSWCFVEI